jgi:hypothetical protein
MAEREQKIFRKQTYAITGEAILTALDILLDTIPARYAGAIKKVENVLASVEPIQVEDTPSGEPTTIPAAQQT